MSRGNVSSGERSLRQVEVTDHLRPFLHFTAPTNWINDPNGMVYYDGEYHLFYQHYPHDNVWGPMHWGHAVSTDLINWQHLPVALHPDEHGYIFSGSGVIDWHNTAGFGPEAMVLLFTYHEPEQIIQSQGLAYSLDRGRSWTKYHKNPILPPPSDVQDFRDPKVFWYQNSDGSGHWVMLLAAGGVVMIYTSPNLRDWTFGSEFGVGHTAKTGVWETPDLFELPVDGGPNRRWVLTVGIGEGAPIGKIKTRYFIGQFDGVRFTNDNPVKQLLWADRGADFYAAQSWSDVPNGRRLWLGWMSNWFYAQKTPPTEWRGVMSLPREVTLTQTSAGVRLVQTAVFELKKQRNASKKLTHLQLNPAAPFVPDTAGELLEIVADFVLNDSSGTFGIRVQVGDGENTAVGYDPKQQKLFVDRTRSGQTDFHDDFAAVHWAEYSPPNQTLRLHLFVDRSTIELFVDGGIITFAERVFPRAGNYQIELFTTDDAITVQQLEVHSLSPANFYLPETG